MMRKLFEAIFRKVSDGGKTCENELTKKCGNGILRKIVKKKLMFRSLILHSIHAAETIIELTYPIDESMPRCTLPLMFGMQLPASKIQ
jgi:hypothetical protein